MTIYPESPFAFTLFCDDVRQEVGGKMMYIGVYNEKLIFAGSAPQTLQNIWAVLTYVEPFGVEAKQVRIEITFPGKEVPAISLVALENGQERGVERTRPDSRLKIHTSIPLGPIEVEEEGIIRVRWFYGDDEILAGSLDVSFAGDEAEAAILSR